MLTPAGIMYFSTSCFFALDASHLLLLYYVSLLADFLYL